MNIPRPSRAEISLSALHHNFEIAKKLSQPDAKVMGIVKAEAYGHGMLRVANELQNAGAAYLGVAYIQEGVALRQAGIQVPILVFGPVSEDSVATALELSLTLTIDNLARAHTISKASTKQPTFKKKAVVHIKVDTGMTRLGLDWQDAENSLGKICALPGLEIQGLYSHFACAGSDPKTSHNQLQRFSRIQAILTTLIGAIPYIHIANSAALVQIPAAKFTLTRPGILIYGYEPTTHATIGVIPVMRLISCISSIRRIPANTGVGYDHTWKSTAATRIAVIPLGYGDGYSRNLSGKSRVLVRGKSFHLVGRICMDQLMIDLGPEGQEQEGDEVLLFGNSSQGSIPGEELCKALDTIPYELTCMINSRVPRVYVI